MRILLFGGSFNPVHWGHLILAEEVREEFGYDRVLFIPAAQAPHKAEAQDPGAGLRLELLRIACAGNPAFGVDDWELRRPGPSYTIDTLRGLPGRYAYEGLPGLVLGDDLAAGFGQWREPDAVASLAELILARRLGTDPGLAWPHRRASNRLIPLSSSEIRQRLAEGLSVRYLLPPGVESVIREKGLYGAR